MSVFEHMVRQHVDFLRGNGVRDSRISDGDKIPDSVIAKAYADAYGLQIIQAANVRKYGFGDSKTGEVYVRVSSGASNYTNLFNVMRKFIAKQRRGSK